MVKDYTDINIRTPMDMFNRKLADVVLKYGKMHKPYDSACARLEFVDKIEKAEKESERKHGFIKFDDVKVEINEEDLEKYGDIDRFELLEDQEDYQDKVIEGSRTQVIIGHTLSYRCKERGHGVSVFIPIAEYNEMMRKKDNSKKEVRK